MKRTRTGKGIAQRQGKEELRERTRTGKGTAQRKGKEEHRERTRKRTNDFTYTYPSNLWDC